MKLGDLIRQRLKEMGWSQTDLANRVGMTSSQISRIISGDRGTTIENLVLIADALNINRDVFLRAAANLPQETGTDAWVEDMKHKLSQIPPELRERAGPMLDAIIEGFAEAESAPRRPRGAKAKTKPAT